MTNDWQSKPTGESASERVANFCRDIVLHLGMDLAVEVSGTDEEMSVNLSGPDRSYLLSNTAALLNSLEYLVNKIFRSGKDEKSSGIILDSDNYRQHREAELVLLAQMASKKVIAQQKPLGLQPMIPRERRIIHLALAEIEGVRSESEGEGDNRSITIYPAE